MNLDLHQLASRCAVKCIKIHMEKTQVKTLKVLFHASFVPGQSGADTMATCLAIIKYYKPFASGYNLYRVRFDCHTFFFHS